MVTADERREVARKLRELCDYETAETIVRTCLGFERGELMDKVTRRRMSDRIADLIDPAESGQDQDKNGTCRDESGQCPKAARNCSEPTRKCDRDALLELADGMRRDAREHISSTSLTLVYAARILSAIGVDDG